MNHVVDELAVNQTLANGNTILMVYDLFVIFLFFFEFFLFINKERYLEEIKRNMASGTIKPIRKTIFKITKYYDKHGLGTVTVLLMVICIVVTSMTHPLTLQEFLGICVSFLLFFTVMYFVQRLFVGLDQFENSTVSRYVDVIFYIILGHYFVYFARFISVPNLFLSFVGLSFALLLCFTVMIRAIINPGILMKPADNRKIENKEAFGIIKGMGALMGCEIGILYLMVYSCYQTNPAFYHHTAERALDSWDLLYYLFVSFSTIGYGDIYPMRPDGMFYSCFTAIIISITSIFSTACFVGAVVSGASAMRQDKESEN